MWEIAPEYGAAVVFAEHRYCMMLFALPLSVEFIPYHAFVTDGKSMPVGDASFNSSRNLQWLTVEQAMADYATLIPHLQQAELSETPSSAGPVIIFGGSYGGMLATWFKLKYSHIAWGAVAARYSCGKNARPSSCGLIPSVYSAPVWYFGDVTPLNGFNVIVTQDYADGV